MGTPDRLATLRGSLDGVAVVCWLLGGATGDAGELRALHTTRLELFLTQAIDSTVRGFLFEARGSSTPPEELARGEEVTRRLTGRNQIPATFLREDPAGRAAWQQAALDAIGGLLEPARRSG